MPEFGEDLRQNVTGYPARFCQAENFSGGASNAVSPVVPDNQMWILLGADFSAQVPAPANVLCTVFMPPTSVILWQLDFPVQVYFPELTDELRMTNGGGSWRGALPHYPGERVNLECEATGGSIYTSCGGWGIVLPYVGPIVDV